MNDNLDLKDIFARLVAPFHPDDIEWRAGATSSDKTKALALAYITSRAVMDRLDEIIGPENWKDEYAPGPDGGVICGLSLRINGEWITKWDGAENTEFEAIKGGLSDAFKRAGYKWGIGRYLYKLESAWVACEARGKSIVLKKTPPLPAWALPNEQRDTPSAMKSPNTPSSPQNFKEREQQILTELGYGKRSAPEPVPAPVAPISAGPKQDGSSGNGKSAASKAKTSSVATAPKPNDKRPGSWSAEVVQAVLKAKLAASPAEAVRLLNDAGLEASVTSEQAVTRIRALRKN